jgi:glutamate--glyoxylate aminotransferase
MCRAVPCCGVLCCAWVLLQGTGGECGLRGGYVEMCNIHPKTVEELYKICSINLSPNGVGQVRAATYVCR